jgi:hypothetical protein
MLLIQDGNIVTLMNELKKRKWMYVQKPYSYEIVCDKCNGTNIEWSEFEGLIWCYDCQIDTKGTGGVFDGPIPLEVAGVLGMSFDRIDLERKCLMRYNKEKNDYVAVQGFIPKIKFISDSKVFEKDISQIFKGASGFQ